jgi:hypothetical protein
VEESKGVAESSVTLISNDDTWCFENSTFKKRVNEGDSCEQRHGGPLTVRSK